VGGLLVNKLEFSNSEATYGACSNSCCFDHTIGDGFCSGKDNAYWCFKAEAEKGYSKKSGEVCKAGYREVKGICLSYESCKWTGSNAPAGVWCPANTDPRCKKDNPPAKTPTPTPQPTPTATAGTATPTPTITPTLTPSPTSVAKSYLKICKFKDDNGNGYKDGEDRGISWVFNYNDENSIRSVESGGWKIWDKGCVKVEVPVGKNITVSEEGKNGWELTGVYQDGNKTSGGNYIYTSEANKTKEVWFLNKENSSATPVPGEPNSCNGTCGSNYNCKSGLYCYNGYCRNPKNPESTSCNDPEVLGATAPPVLPKTGGNTWLTVISLLSIAGQECFYTKSLNLCSIYHLPFNIFHFIFHWIIDSLDMKW
jgi:hypothetical protein